MSELFDFQVNSEATGKTLESLAKSRDGYAEILRALGTRPKSIIDADFSSCATDSTARQNDLSAMPESTAFRMSGVQVRGEGAGLSRFPQNVGRFFVLFYSKPRDLVLDPFAGHNSRMELCWRAGRDYCGNDISRNFQAMNAEIADELIITANEELIAPAYIPKITLNVGDSRRLPWENGIGDFTITSPPYYNLEHYGDEPEQLGLGARNYSDFIERLGEVCRENFRVLKPGRFAVWFVNDFRLDGKFYDYHCDTIKIMQRAGFNHHDTAIINFGQSVRAAFANQAIETKILPKIHEFALVFRKPK